MLKAGVMISCVLQKKKPSPGRSAACVRGRCQRGVGPGCRRAASVRHAAPLPVHLPPPPPCFLMVSSTARFYLTLFFDFILSVDDSQQSLDRVLPPLSSTVTADGPANRDP